MPLWIKPLLNLAGRRCGYSSVLVTFTFQTFFHASKRRSWTGYTPEWCGDTEYPKSVGIPCSWTNKKNINAPSQKNRIQKNIIHTFAKSLFFIMSSISWVRLEYKWGWMWFHIWPNHINLSLFSAKRNKNWSAKIVTGSTVTIYYRNRTPNSIR